VTPSSRPANVNRLTVTAIIPAYNEAGRIGSTVRAAAPYADEILVIDDGSRDGTGKEAAQAGATVLCQPTNQGYIAAIKRGFAQARGEVVVTLDGDGEFPAGSIPDLVRPILDGEADMVQGRREAPPRPSEAILSWLANRKAPVGDTGTGFRALRTDLARQLTLKGVCICGILSLEVVSLGGRITEIPISLRQVDKPRRIAWYHIRQMGYLLPWLLRRYSSGGETTS
jgi:glycosyltransferase involved in cell wall biosynthesis